MANLVRASSWKNQKPPPGARINWGHPLARGLYLANIGGRDELVRGLSMTPNGCTPGVTTPYGSAWKVPNGSFYATPPRLIGPRFSTFSRFMVTTIGAGDQTLQAMGGAASNAGWYVAVNTGDGIRLAFGNINYYTLSGTIQSSRPTDVTVTCPANGGTATGYVDGMRSGASAVGTMSTPTTSIWELGANGTGGGSGVGGIMTGSISISYLWDRVLRADEAAWLHAEPYAFIQGPGW
jgi:hypothetical protein